MAIPGPLIRRLAFASCYVYSPSGASRASQCSRLLRTRLKTGDAHFILRFAVRVRQEVAGQSALAGFLGPTSVLVPVPGSAPSADGTVPVATHLAEALIEAGLGRDIWPGLRRVHRVRRSSTAAPGARPTVENHYESFAIESTLALPSQVLLVDDVVTKGRTLLAAAARIQEAYPHAEIRAFALLRTLGFASGVDRLLDPCVGEITWRAGDAHRNP